MKFATYWRDGSTGLDYAHNRYYASSSGRFATADVYDESGKSGDPQSWNRYVYTGADPINRNDPTGLESYYFMNVWTPAHEAELTGSEDSDADSHPGTGGLPCFPAYGERTTCVLIVPGVDGSSNSRAINNTDLVIGRNYEYWLTYLTADIGAAEQIVHGCPPTPACVVIKAAVFSIIVVAAAIEAIQIYEARQAKGEGRTQDRQQRDEEWARQRARELCGRYPTKEEQRKAEQATRGDPRGGRDREDLLADLLEAMGCTPKAPDNHLKWPSKP